ncbi:MAG TPA: helix-turn-helix domain-containing protein, partial [Pyrinomonadaceae bacterium]|nr:helix-turn-helix domain-containing protein [Pyrinomonadaceae bacterium]
ERSLILARTSEGKKRAIERGVKMGRKKKLSPYQQDELLARLRTGETQMALSRSYGISQSTISQMAAASGV